MPFVCGLLGLGAAVIDVFDGEVKLVFMALGTAKLGAAIGQHPQQLDAVLIVERHHPVIEDLGRGDRRLAIIEHEKAKADKEAHGEFESECPGYCGAQDTFYVGTLKGVGRVYQQTVIDTYTKVAFAKLYDRKTPITAAEILNDRVVPFYDEHGIRLSRMLTDRGTEFC